MQIYHDQKPSSRNFDAARIRHARLVWGDAESINTVRDLATTGFDVVIGTDIVHLPAFMPLLFQTISQLLAHSAQVPLPLSRLLACRHSMRSECAVQALLVLCHITRRVSEDQIVAAAAAEGLQRRVLPPEMQRASYSLHLGAGPHRLLCFAWRQ